MADQNLTDIIDVTVRAVRERWDPLGYVEAESAFATGHTPSVAPMAYLCRFYAGLDDAALGDAEGESERHLPAVYRQFLRAYNGAHVMGVSLMGATGGQNLRDAAAAIGQPVSIRYQNAFYLRPDFIPEGHFGIGTMNGNGNAQGHLYLTSTGEVELINREHNLIAITWPSLADFLSTEIPRQFSRYDAQGNDTGQVARLPGNTQDWEALGKQAADQRKKENSVSHKLMRKLGMGRKG